MILEFLKEITSKCEGKDETETACLQIARADGKPVLFSNIEDNLTCSKNSTQEQGSRVPDGRPRSKLKLGSEDLGRGSSTGTSNMKPSMEP